MTTTKSKNKENKINALICHGVNFQSMPEKGTAEGDCPFCGKEEHFFCHVQTGKWQCKKCLKEGNHYSFLVEHYAACKKATTKADYDMLSSQRGGVPGVAFKNWGYVYDRDQHRWLMPLYNDETKLSNLLRWDAHEDKPQAKSTPCCSLHLIGHERIKAVGPIHIFEGWSDGPTGEYMFTKGGLDSGTNSYVAVPGAGFALDRYLERLKGRDLIYYYDNDPAGIDGQNKQYRTFEGKAKSQKRITWPEGAPEGYDVRDFAIERLAKPKSFVKDIQSLFSYADKVEVKDLPKVPDFKTLVKHFRKRLHLEQNQVNALAVCCATVVSKGTRGTPIWVFLVGPPGSGKSEMLMAFSQLEEYCFFVSRLTSETYISGMARGDSDPSVLAMLQNRCLIIKDFTAIKAMSIEKQVDLMGMKRDAYDGEVCRPFGNGEMRVYKDCWYPCLSGVTHVIHADNQSQYGERFLKFELLDDGHDVLAQTKASMLKSSNEGKSDKPDETLKKAILAFFSQRKLERSKLPDVIKTKYHDKLLALAQVVAIVRTSVDRKGSAMAYRPIPENPGRLGSVFIKLSQHLCWVFDKKKMDDEIYEIVKKTGTDTVISWALEVIRVLVRHPKGLTVAEITRELQVALDTIKPHLELLCQIVYPYAKNAHGPVIHIEDQQTESALRSIRRYRIDPRFTNLWKTAEIPLNLKSSKRVSTRGPKKGARYTKKEVA